LKKAIEDEGLNIEEHMFEIGTTPAKKNVTHKEDVDELEESESEPKSLETSTLEETVMDTTEETELTETNDKVEEEVPEKKQEDINNDTEATVEKVEMEEKVEDALDDGISISIEDEEKLLADEDEPSEKKTNEKTESGIVGRNFKINFIINSLLTFFV